MPILRMITCAVCDEAMPEPVPNQGWPQWGSLQGVSLDGEDNPCLCPEHLALTANFVDSLKHGLD